VVAGHPEQLREAWGQDVEGRLERRLAVTQVAGEDEPVVAVLGQRRDGLKVDPVVQVEIAGRQQPGVTT
jgi:hypothetical protein